MRVKCTNKKCQHTWDYGGKSNHYVGCPRCHYNSLLKKAITNQQSTSQARAKTFRDTLRAKLPSFIGDVNMKDGKRVLRSELKDLP